MNLENVQAYKGIKNWVAEFLEKVGSASGKGYDLVYTYWFKAQFTQVCGYDR